MCFGADNFSCAVQVEEDGTQMTLRWTPTWSAQLFDVDSNQRCQVSGEPQLTFKACERERLFLLNLSGSTPSRGVLCHLESNGLCFARRVTTKLGEGWRLAMCSLPIIVPPFFLLCIWCFAAAGDRRHGPTEGPLLTGLLRQQV
mmetsp:Transcript_2238/g.6390  ORF Transcript_2238/g.6390 Transcript_2238/m.6390 type:complete len:144 (-) Transcript_2238:19-450(-)